MTMQLTQLYQHGQPSYCRPNKPLFDQPEIGQQEVQELNFVYKMECNLKISRAKVTLLAYNENQ